jgi:hypothetical protein
LIAHSLNVTVRWPSDQIIGFGLASNCAVGGIVTDATDGDVPRLRLKSALMTPLMDPNWNLGVRTIVVCPRKKWVLELRAERRPGTETAPRRVYSDSDTLKTCR